MDLRQIRYFVKLAECLNFSEASRSLCITQSTLSQQIKQLETEFGTQLFVRTSHSVALTEAGCELLPMARRAIRTADDCRSRIEDLSHLRCGTLNIGVTYSFSPILTESIVTFMKLYPGIKLNVLYKPMSELMELLVSRDLDFVLAFKPNEPIPGVESHYLFQNFLAVIVPDSHPLAAEKGVTIDMLRRYDIALPSRGLQARNALERMAGERMAELNVKIELNEVNILLKLLRQAKLVSVLAEATVMNESGITAIPLLGERCEMDGCVHVLNNSYRKRSMQEFIKILSNSIAVRARQNAWL